MARNAKLTAPAKEETLEAVRRAAEKAAQFLIEGGEASDIALVEITDERGKVTGAVVVLEGELLTRAMGAWIRSSRAPATTAPEGF